MGSRLLLKIHQRKTGDTPSTYRLDECDEHTTNWYVDEQRLRRSTKTWDEPSDPDPTVESASEESASEEPATEDSATTVFHQKGTSCESCASYERGFEKGWEKAWRKAKEMSMVDAMATES